MPTAKVAELQTFCTAVQNSVPYRPPTSLRWTQPRTDDTPLFSRGFDQFGTVFRVIAAPFFALSTLSYPEGPTFYQNCKI